MKKTIQALILITLLILGGLFIQSCEKVKDAVAFDVQEDMPAHAIQLDSASTSKGEEVLLYSSYFEIDLEKIFTDSEIDDGKISNGGFTAITLDIDVEKSNKTFGFISSINFKLGFDENPENAILIAKKEGILDSDTELSFDILEEDIYQYIENKKFYFYIYGVKEAELPTNKLDLILKSKVKFTVNPLN